MPLVFLRQGLDMTYRQTFQTALLSPRLPTRVVNGRAGNYTENWTGIERVADKLQQIGCSFAAGKLSEPLVGKRTIRVKAMHRGEVLTMRFFRLLLLFLLLGAGGNVLADRGQHGQRGHFSHHRHGAVIIAPFWGPGWYYPPYPQTIVVEQAVPQVYIEQASGQPVSSGPSAGSGNYWYYCAAAKAYYPDVNECPAGWLPVLPQAPDQR